MPQLEPVGDETWVLVDDPRAANLLLDVEGLRFLRPFMGRESSLAEAAHVLEVRLNTMHYRVKRLSELGLLRRVRVKRRGGRPVNYYGASGDGYFVPFRLTSLPLIEDGLLAWEEPLRNALARGILRAASEGLDDFQNWGVSIKGTAEGGVATGITSGAGGATLEQWLLEDPCSPAIWMSWTSLELDYRTAKELQQDMVALWQKYTSRRLKGAHRYLLRLALAPDSD